MILPAAAASVKLAWNPNPEPNIANYRLSYGTASRSYTQNVDAGTATSVTVSGLEQGSLLGQLGLQRLRAQRRFQSGFERREIPGGFQRGISDGSGRWSPHRASSCSEPPGMLMINLRYWNWKPQSPG
jgi:hypothetical protein